MVAPKKNEAKDGEGAHIIVVLKQCGIESVKTKHGYELLSADDHKGILAKNKRNIAAYRPDIVHRALLTLLDSPLNKFGCLTIFVHTLQNQLIKISGSCRLPRNYKRFAGLMVQCLHKNSVNAKNSGEKLMKIVKNPVTRHFPAGSYKVGTSTTGELIHPSAYVNRLNLKKPVVFMFGGHSHGQVKCEWVDEWISVSQYGLSSSIAINRMLNALENKLDIL